MSATGPFYLIRIWCGRCLFLDLGGAELIAELLDFDLDSDEMRHAPGWRDLAYLERVCAVRRCCVSPGTVVSDYSDLVCVCASAIRVVPIVLDQRG